MLRRETTRSARLKAGSDQASSLIDDVLPLKDGGLRRAHADVLRSLRDGLGDGDARLQVVGALEVLLVATLEEENLSLALLSRDVLRSSEVGAAETDCERSERSGPTLWGACSRTH